MTDQTARLGDVMTLTRGPSWSNRIALAPLTNTQSHDDGTLSEDEFRWLTMRAEGGFALTMTCAAHVMAMGQGFPGQLGVWSDNHLPGLSRLAEAINATGSISSLQLHHAGRRSPTDLIHGQPVCAFDDAETGARALSINEIEEAIEAYVSGGVRAERAGFHGVEIHGAHGYLIGQFLDADNNTRADGWGGDEAGRNRFVLEIIERLRAATGPQFQIGLRLSPERFGIDTMACRRLVADVMAGGRLDYVDMSLWDVFKQPMDPALQDRSLSGWFTDLPRHGTKLGVAGKIGSALAAQSALDQGADFAMIGRAAVLHHDFARKALADASFAAVPIPVSPEWLANEGLSPKFVEYMRAWKNFVTEPA